jgi:hypothetical protein
MSTHGQHQDQAVTFFFEAEKTLRDYSVEFGPADFSDLDEVKDNTNLLLSALVVTFTLFILVGAGLVWFIRGNIVEREPKLDVGHYAYIDVKES